jgi:acyl dehydratase
MHHQYEEGVWMLDGVALKEWPFQPVEQVFTAKDAMLYALSVGFCSDPIDERELQFVYEKGLVVVPTMAVVLSYPGLWISDPRTGMDWANLVHGEQVVRFHSPLPPGGRVVGLTKVVSVTDKGPGKGATFVQTRTLRNADTGDVIATLEQLNLARADGGYSEGGGKDGRQVSDPPPAKPHPLPERDPDAIIELPTFPQQALFYRLCADPHPVHVDPRAARSAGFKRPILHGLGSYGIACRGLLRACCEYEPRRLKSLRTRFSSPLYPGEVLEMDIWREGRLALFRCRARSTGAVVLNNGVAEIEE